MPSYVFTKYYYGKGEDQEEAWKNASPRLDVEYDEVDTDLYEEYTEQVAREGRVS